MSHHARSLLPCAAAAAVPFSVDTGPWLLPFAGWKRSNTLPPISLPSLSPSSLADLKCTPAYRRESAQHSRHSGNDKIQSDVGSKSAAMTSATRIQNWDHPWAVAAVVAIIHLVCTTSDCFYKSHELSSLQAATMTAVQLGVSHCNWMGRPASLTSNLLCCCSQGLVGAGQPGSAL